ncbi:PREDICTED: DNA polymerase subunit gamma-2, mitochondrial [Dufourea novaeangliae]|uniref:DNA polymerase subunit gamma-2, mitochondrial n=1 Tax=Dufourea novaeangliae TaxID=178035 RepID=UPI0007673736|nr:PREDICTED: DNA polymerase subunit gamma-2, mitochondrial [Dufourea novaeangliae]
MTVTRILKEISTNFINFTDHGFMYGPQGRMLLRNLEEHWFLHCITMSLYNIFLSEKSTSTLNLLTKSPIGEIPFGLATLKDSNNSWNKSIQPMDIEVENHKIAEVAIFHNNTEAKDSYHKLQKERKIWWRKLAQYPSRFKITEPKKTENFDFIDIEGQFPFGTITVERITYHTNIQNLLQQIDIKKGLADIQMVEHVVSLDWGCLALLCDAYDINETAKMHIHPKLAPHKVAIHIKKSKNEATVGNDDLNRFVLYLNNMLRKKGLNTILTSSEEVVNMCLVPFIVLVDRTSLENGIIYVTNRSTTLSQAIHITDLVKYIIMHC